MEMTRRKFIQKAIETAAAIAVGVFWLAEKTGMKKFVRAGKLKIYPGTLKPLGNINSQSKWSG
jgi:hypothetical protein